MRENIKEFEPPKSEPAEKSAEKRQEFTEQEKEALTTLKNYVNEQLETKYKEGEMLLIPLTLLPNNEEQPVETKLVTYKLLRKLVATFEQTWNVISTSTGRGDTLEFTAIKPGEEPEATREFTEQEKEALTTLKNYVNEQLKTKYKEGEMLLIPLTLLPNNEEQPVETKFVTYKLLRKLVAAFEQTWNVISTSTGRGDTLEFTTKEKE